MQLDESVFWNVSYPTASQESIVPKFAITLVRDSHIQRKILLFQQDIFCGTCVLYQLKWLFELYIGSKGCLKHL